MTLKNLAFSTPNSAPGDFLPALSTVTVATSQYMLPTVASVLATLQCLASWSLTLEFRA